MPTEVDISKIELPNGTTYNLKSGTKGAGEVDISKIVLPDGTICNIKGGGSEIFAHLYVNIDSGAVVTATSTNATYTATAGSGDEAFIEIGKAGTYTISATKNGLSSSTTTVSILESGGVYNETVNFIRLTINVPSGSSYTITDGTTTISGTSSGDDIFNYLPNTGNWTVSCTDGTDNASETITVSSYTDYLVILVYARTYGVSWNKSSSSVLTRTDDAASFSNPVPFINDGKHPGSSPFDTLMPWSGMEKVTIDGNVLVKIPKFWFKWTRNSSTLKLQISNAKQEGFMVSPAHQARNSNEQDRDFVYIGRYKCVNDTSDATNDYKSQSGKSPMTNITRATARTLISWLGTGYWQQDFAMFWTIRMLYLVEFADWNSQATIGNGCGNGSSVVSTGSTDSMPYHTGSMQYYRTSYNGGTQYRWIEGLWDNVFEWCDGIFFAGTSKLGVYIVKNPANFTDTDTTNAVNVGQRVVTSECISDFFVPSKSGYEWALYTNAVSGTDYSKYVADRCIYNSSGVVLRIGGCYTQNQSYGMFYLLGNDGASNQSSNIGSRLMYLPPNS